MKPSIALEGAKPVREKFLTFGSPRIESDEIDEVVDSLRKGWLSAGPKVTKFEEMFKDYIGSRCAVALNSCTAGMHLGLKVAGIGPGDEVITSPLTFPATANVIIHLGATPVFVDVEAETMNIDAGKIEERITKKTKALMPVHLAGRPAEMETITDIAKRHNLIVIEDAAHALEARYHGKKIGAISDITAFSFYVTKNLCTGEGGMITTGRDDWAKRIKILSLHGLDKGAWDRYSKFSSAHYRVVEAGYKCNMMDLQAALGIHQLKKVDSYLEIREKIWRTYDEAFEGLPLVKLKPVPENVKHARHLYVLLLDLEKLKADRDRIRQALHAENIGTGVHFISLHLQPYYAKRFAFKADAYPAARFISERTISIPLSAKLTDGDVEDVTKAVQRVLEHYRR